MTELAEAEFKVVRDAEEQLWLEILCGKGSGLRVAVPKRDSEYHPSLVTQIQNIKQGAIVDATLVSTNERNTAWRFKNIKDARPEDSGVVSADD